MKTGDVLRAGSKVQIKKIGVSGWTDYITQKDVTAVNPREILMKTRRGPNGVNRFWVFTCAGYEIRVKIS